MTMTKQQLHKTAVEYMPRLGGFATKLADAYLHADGNNQRKIEEKFMDDFERAYRMWHTEGKSVRIKTSELTGAALDWAVAKCEGFTDYNHATETMMPPRKEYGRVNLDEYSYSTDWAQGGPIIQREELSNLKCYSTDHWDCDNGDITCDGPTPLIAAMRCYVTSKLGDEVEIPEELK